MSRRPPPPTAPGPLLRVDDPDDSRLGPFRDLRHRAPSVRRGADAPLVVVEGRLAVERLLTSDYAVRALLVDDHQVAAAAVLVEATRAQGAPVYVGSRPVVAGTVGFDLHRGVVAVADAPPPSTPEGIVTGALRPRPGGGPPPLVAVLEGLNDHENIGALFRNAAAFGVAGVLLDPRCADPLYRRSIRVSMGHVLHTPFARLEPWPAGLDALRRAGFVVAALSPHRAARAGAPTAGLRDLGARSGRDGRGIALVLGAEGPGVSSEALAACDAVVGIPMAPGVDSLNVATAAAIAFHALTWG